MDKIKLSSFKSGDLIAKSGTSFLAKVVRLFTLSDFSHVGIVIVEEDGVYVVEAARPEVRKTPIEEMIPFYHIPMMIDRVDPVLKANLESHLGSKYSMFQAAISFIGIHIPDDKWYCTELAYDFYSRAGFHFKEKLTPTKFVREALNVHGILKYIARR